MTKLAKILIERSMTQRDLQRTVEEKYGFKIGDDRISKMVNGKLTNYHIQTAKLIADSLQIKIDDIVE